MPRRFLFESRSVTQAHTAFSMLYLNMREENKTLKKVPTPGLCLSQVLVGSKRLQSGCVTPVSMEPRLM